MQVSVIEIQADISIGEFNQYLVALGANFAARDEEVRA